MKARSVVSLAVAMATLFVLNHAPASAAGRVARLTLRSGEQKTVALEGVGCSISMCSRTVVNSREEGDALVRKTRLDTIAAIEDVTTRDALFVFKDGTERRLSVTDGNRVLYIANRAGGEKIDLSQIKALEFVSDK